MAWVREQFASSLPILFVQLPIHLPIKLPFQLQIDLAALNDIFRVEIVQLNWLHLRDLSFRNGTAYTKLHLFGRSLSCFPSLSI